MKVATFNVNSIRKRIPIVLGWLARAKPDVLCLQETKVQDAEFPLDALKASGYHVAFRGMKAYNGVAVLSLKEPEFTSFGLRDGQEPDDPRLAHVVIDGIAIINTYVPQGYLIDSPKYQIKLEWLRRFRRYLDKNFKPSDKLIWTGDMNVAPRPMDVHHPEKHEKHVCYHVDGRKAYEAVAAFGLEDVFVKLYPDRQQFTFWDYRFRPGGKSALEANLGWRIDHILATKALAGCVTAADVDLEARRAESASDHTVLWAEFDLRKFSH